jgi:chromosome partitioning protein
MTRIIAIFHPAGGVGKTTTALNLGYTLAQQEQHVLLVDLDPQADLSDRLDLTGDTPQGTLARVLAAGKGTPTVMHAAWKGIGFDVIPGSLEEMSGLDMKLAGAQKREERLTRALTSLLPKYDYVLLDCPPNITLLGVNALYAADSVLVPVQAQDKAIRQLATLFENVEEVREYRGGIKPAYLGLVLTMVDSRTRQGRAALQDLREEHGNLVFQTTIPDRTELQNDGRYSQPIGVYAPGHDAALAYWALAKEVISRAR